MKYLLALLLVPILSASDCGHHKTKDASTQDGKQAKDSVPVCLRELIDEGAKQTPSNAPEEINEYTYKGKKVYLVTAPCCDQFNMLYDDSCKAICAASGGLTGRGDGKCNDFDSVAKHVKLIWKNPSK